MKARKHGKAQPLAKAFSNLGSTIGCLRLYRARCCVFRKADREPATGARPIICRTYTRNRAARKRRSPGIYVLDRTANLVNYGYAAPLVRRQEMVDRLLTAAKRCQAATDEHRQSRAPRGVAPG